ncbi:7alpha-cephem-methoxylase P8 chain related protein [Rhodotorula toruloides]|uniref:BY PROTMAP: gi/472588621/gb/EMS26093.1/ 7alpha-cephem-methoxylase P8 chain related protein [Rhodosporidium toruloides NP11] gi/647396410/emb/CDR38581.1/ RHTO0S03e11012g1_1 [Rhodosporidium toruloides] n=1 Tax=Rhodotorula toruloides TaxID=5286 RepID=A0A0K3CRP2_RHOTO|nr:7alpha-cephem-methoxylase P8 chain related protein [Rhodotorula toruloides]
MLRTLLTRQLTTTARRTMSTVLSPAELAAATKPALEADLVYFSGETTDGQKPYQLQFPSPGPSLPSTNAILQTHLTPIHDLRPLIGTPAAEGISTETTGFGILPRDRTGTKMRYEDWKDEEKVRSVYYKEVDELFKREFGATRTIIFDHTIRRTEPEGKETPDTPSNRKPVARVHVDQTPASGERRVRRHAGADADRLLRGRAQLINLWRPLRGPVLDIPLAIADARTLSPSTDLVQSRLIYPQEGEGAQPEGETLSVKWGEGLRWYYLSEMGADEVLLLKCWEHSPEGKVGTITPHTAFVDPRYYGKEGVQLRESVEVRVLVFHEPEE